MKTKLAGLAAVLVLGTVPAAAQTGESEAVKATTPKAIARVSEAAAPQRVDLDRPAPSARALALSRRLLAAQDVEADHRAMMDSMMQAAIQSRPAQISEAKVRAMHEGMAADLAAVLPAMTDRIAVLQAQVYTEEELQALVDFNESPVGRSVDKKAALLGPGMTAVMVEFAPRLQRGMFTRICADSPDPAECMSMFTAR